MIEREREIERERDSDRHTDRQTRKRSPRSGGKKTQRNLQLQQEEGERKEEATAQNGFLTESNQ